MQNTTKHGSWVRCCDRRLNGAEKAAEHIDDVYILSSPGAIPGEDDLDLIADKRISLAGVGTHTDCAALTWAVQHGLGLDDTSRTGRRIYIAYKDIVQEVCDAIRNVPGRDQEEIKRAARALARILAVKGSNAILETMLYVPGAIKEDKKVVAGVYETAAVMEGIAGEHLSIYLPDEGKFFRLNAVAQTLSGLNSRTPMIDLIMKPTPGIAVSKPVNIEELVTRELESIKRDMAGRFSRRGGYAATPPAEFSKPSQPTVVLA